MVCNGKDLFSSNYSKCLYQDWLSNMKVNKTFYLFPRYPLPCKTWPGFVQPIICLNRSGKQEPWMLCTTVSGWLRLPEVLYQRTYLILIPRLITFHCPKRKDWCKYRDGKNPKPISMWENNTQSFCWYVGRFLFGCMAFHLFHSLIPHKNP